MKWWKSFGPGLMVTAAFIGPGTVTTASKAGANFGFALIWALVFSVFAACVLQEMSARLGLVTRAGLGEALRSTFDRPALRFGAIFMVIAAIAAGNAAYEAGNISGASLGLESVLGGSVRMWAMIVGVGAFALLSCGAYVVIERILMVLVGVMSVTFIFTAVQVRPALGPMFSALFNPQMPEGSLTTVVALIGTTVAPYNLFLHASAVSAKWSKSEDVAGTLRASRLDTGVAISLGGLVTLAILATAATTFFGTGIAIVEAKDMAVQLEPLLGSNAKYFFATGLFSAGLTSAITAPLAAAYATCGAMGWGTNPKSWRFRGVWAAILIIGTAVPAAGQKNPLQVILFAQAANGILLPISAIFLLVVMNRSSLLGKYTNGPVSNAMGGLVVLVAMGLGGWKLFGVISALLPAAAP